MKVIHKVEPVVPGEREYTFHCPGCGCSHWFKTEGKPKWTWNNDFEKPTINPSILVRSGNEKGQTVCHFFVKDGTIQYLGDCTHELKGQIVVMVDD